MSKENETKICKSCKTEIPKGAKVCPNCRKKQGGMFKWIIIAVVAVIIISAVAGGGDDTSDEPQKVGEVQNENKNGNEAQATEEKVDNNFKVGDVVETDNLKISYLSAKEHKEEYLEPKDGYMYYRMEFEFENIGDSEETVSSLISWQCYADGYSMDSAWVGDDTLDATIAPGKKAKGSIYYEIPKDAKEVTLEYETSFWTEDKIVFVVK